MFDLAIPFIVGEIPDTSHNFNSGLKSGDKIVGIDSKEVFILQAISKILGSKKGEQIVAQVERDNSIIDIPLTINQNGLIGVGLEGNISNIFKVTKSEYTIPSAISAGFNRTFTTISDYLKELKLIFSPETEAYKSVGSFITMGSIFPTTWNWEIFWNITGWLSVMLAVLNILPIPALDGGHLVFTLYEMITRKKPSDKFLEYAQLLGMLILFGIMILAFGNDIFRLFN